MTTKYKNVLYNNTFHCILFPEIIMEYFYILSLWDIILFAKPHILNCFEMNDNIVLSVQTFYDEKEINCLNVQGIN